ncbi:hypothetical protein AKUH3B111A_01110 [Apilactobacillus kunkeei]|nr:hypothetical protein AKUH3B104X_01110 [Apilactobacillus kunkeei]CAI2554969.1 hypothetical protein AKUH3B111A_01110 [Apilactobacillus kunkeei]CAI2555039.1 hypothetical protein AKUH3B103M_01110 [Apilactobacillus kunkeei]
MIFDYFVFYIGHVDANGHIKEQNNSKLKKRTKFYI